MNRCRPTFPALVDVCFVSLALCTATLAAPAAVPLAAQDGGASRPDVRHLEVASHDVVRYHALPESHLDVLTEKTGLFSFFGHDHLIRADEFQGTVDYSRSSPEHSSVAFTVQSAGVRVLTPADSADLADIQRDMEAKVLRPTEFPTIDFRSTSVAPIEGGVRVLGELTLVGVVQEVAVDLALDQSGTDLRAVGEFTTRLRDFGIEPPTAAAGTVKVKNEVLFRLDVRLAPAGDPRLGPG